MGIKHLTTIELILKNHGLPMSKPELSNRYQKRTGLFINSNTLGETLDYLIKKKKVNEIKNKHRTQYMWRG